MSGTSAEDYAHMARALVLATRGLYSTDPNPRVGCVVVNAGEVVGEGWHQRAGGPHAEAFALQQARERARGATAYVTLEPCCHHGRTPPCTDALLRAGVARVVIGGTDPDPRVAGSGLRQLEAAGVEVVSGVLQEQAEALNSGFLMRMRAGRPLVRVKLAMSLDGRTAMASGESQWITGPAARVDVQRLRARSSAIMTGAGTLRHDDPSLTVRALDAELEAAAGLRQPLRVVLDPRLETPPQARMLQLPGRTVLLYCAASEARRTALQDAGAEVVALPGAAEGVDLDAALRWLARQEVNELLVEAGATLAGALLRGGWLDELVLYVAPCVMGSAARGLFHLPGLERMVERVPLRIVDVRAVGADWRITARCA